MYQGVHLHSFQSLCCHDALASDQISLFLHLSQLVFHLDGIVCLVSHALTKISLLFSHLCKYIKKKSLSLDYFALPFLPWEASLLSQGKKINHCLLYASSAIKYAFIIFIIILCCSYVFVCIFPRYLELSIGR